MDESNVMSIASVERWLRSRKSPQYKYVRTGLMKVIGTLKEMKPDLQEYAQDGCKILAECLSATFTKDNNQIDVYTLHGIKGMEYDHGVWIERQNTPSQLATRFGEAHIKMKQERHLEIVGLTRWRKSLNIHRTTSSAPCRADRKRLIATVFPEDDDDDEPTYIGCKHFHASAYPYPATDVW